MHLNRREFLGSALAPPLAKAGTGYAVPVLADSKTCVGLVQSTNAKLPAPVSPEDPLDYAKVREMVWKAIEYGPPRPGDVRHSLADISAARQAFGYAPAVDLLPGLQEYLTWAKSDMGGKQACGS